MIQNLGTPCSACPLNNQLELGMIKNLRSTLKLSSNSVIGGYLWGTMSSKRLTNLLLIAKTFHMPTWRRRYTDDWLLSYLCQTSVTYYECCVSKVLNFKIFFPFPFVHLSIDPYATLTVTNTKQDWSQIGGLVKSCVMCKTCKIIPFIVMKREDHYKHLAKLQEYEL
jgi:hypothetical protein